VSNDHRQCAFRFQHLLVLIQRFDAVAIHTNGGRHLAVAAFSSFYFLFYFYFFLFLTLGIYTIEDKF